MSGSYYKIDEEENEHENDAVDNENSVKKL